MHRGTTRRDNSRSASCPLPHHITPLILAAAILPTVSERLATCAEPARAPNIVLIFTDDQGYNDLGCFGSPDIKTPNIDRMAAEGMRLTSFYTQPVCGPARAALMTGCYPMRIGRPGNMRHGHTELHPNEITIAEVLKGAGYATAILGKWHLGEGPEQMPRGQGFDYFFGTPRYNGATRNVTPRFVCKLMRNEEVIEAPADQSTLTRRYTEQAIEFIRANRDRPFFLYLAHNFPHVPLFASDEFRGKSARGLYGDTIEEIDWSTGRVLETLKELGLDRNTLVIYTSDNGPWLSPAIGDHGGKAQPLRGSKMTTWEGGFRVPCIAWWPGKVPAGAVCDRIATTMDMLPTFARLAGTEPPGDRVIDGKDIWPLLSGDKSAAPPHEAFFYYAETSLQAVRSGKWKLVLARPDNPPGMVGWFAIHTQPIEQPQLYDLEGDLGETRDVAAEHPEEVERLTALAERCRKDLGDGLQAGEGARFWEEGPPADEKRPFGPPPAAREVVDGGGPYPRSFTYRVALGHEPGVARRDPSDVIRVGGSYYVWYTKIRDEPAVYRYPSGYSGTVWCATSPDGLAWTEQGEAVGKGPEGAWNEHGVFTPNILEYDGRYYLYYTAVPRPMSEQTPTAIGIAAADSPDGPWTKLPGNPMLRPSDDPARFDSFRTDDACLIVRDGKVWLYYKGRQRGRSPGQTKMGVALADKPEGPYIKHPGNPVTDSGHEVLCWAHGWGVATLLTGAGPQRNTVQFALDGLHFAPRNRVINRPQAPGAYRTRAYGTDTFGETIKWGISHAGAPNSRDLVLMRFDCQWTPGGQGGRGGRLPGVKAAPYDRAEPVGNLRFDFETGDLQGWAVVEGKFDLVVSDRPALPGWPEYPFNKQGKYHLSTLERRGDAWPADAMTGVIESPVFELKGREMSFLVGGGAKGDTYVALCNLDGDELMVARGSSSPILRRVRWDVGKHAGQKLLLRIVDRRQRDWAHVTFDDFSTEATIDEPATRRHRAKD